MERRVAVLEGQDLGMAVKKCNDGLESGGERKEVLLGTKRLLSNLFSKKKTRPYALAWCFSNQSGKRKARNEGRKKGFAIKKRKVSDNMQRNRSTLIIRLAPTLGKSPRVQQD